MAGWYSRHSIWLSRGRSILGCARAAAEIRAVTQMKLKMTFIFIIGTNNIAGGPRQFQNSFVGDFGARPTTLCLLLLKPENSVSSDYAGVLLALGHVPVTASAG